MLRCYKQLNLFHFQIDCTFAKNQLCSSSSKKIVTYYVDCIKEKETKESQKSKNVLRNEKNKKIAENFYNR